MGLLYLVLYQFVFQPLDPKMLGKDIETVTLITKHESDRYNQFIDDLLLTAQILSSQFNIEQKKLLKTADSLRLKKKILGVQFFEKSEQGQWTALGPTDDFSAADLSISLRAMADFDTSSTSASRLLFVGEKWFFIVQKFIPLKLIT